jgi:hypothetical protein
MGTLLLSGRFLIYLASIVSMSACATIDLEQKARTDALQSEFDILQAHRNEEAAKFYKDDFTVLG